MTSKADYNLIVDTLRGVIDPELHDNIVDLGMLRDVEIDDAGTVTISIALTVASCPLRAQIEADVISKIEGVPGFGDVVVKTGEMTADEKSELMSRARLKAREDAPATQVPATARVIAVSSGKGGVGKSTTTANLAHAIRDRGFTTGVLDADVWGFSQHRMLGIDEQLRGSDGLIDPVDADGIRAVTMGSLVDNEEQALMWRGLILTKAVEQFLSDVRWGDIDYLVVDMPPGTGDVQMGLARMLPQAEMLLVTTPQAAAHTVAVRAANMARRSHMKVTGIVENMSGFTCPCCGERTEVFGRGGGLDISEKFKVPLLGQLPINPSIRESGDQGIPVTASDPDSDEARVFGDMAKKLLEGIMTD